MKLDRNMKKRRRLARSLESAAIPERPLVVRGPRYIVQPAVALACAPSLRALAAALRDETREIGEESIKAVWRLLCGPDSAFLGYDATEALREAVRLQHGLVGAATATVDPEILGVAIAV